MPPIIDAILNNPQFLLSFIGSISLGFALQIFKGGREEEPRKTTILEELSANQIDRILNLIDNEIGRYEIAGNQGAFARLDVLRRNHVSGFLDDIWEEALSAREFEYVWRQWLKWEHRGHDFCAIGLWLNLGFSLIVLFGFQGILSNVIFWSIISFIVFVVPFIVVVACWIAFRVYRDRARRFLERPIRGAPRRRIGDA